MHETQEDPIEALLRMQFDGPVADDGFTDRVMQQLPRQRRSRWPIYLGLTLGTLLCLSTLLIWTPFDSLHWPQNGGSLTACTLAWLCTSLVFSLLSLWWGLYESGDR
ncbi:DUF5056 domain-containing protein [Burkholderiaceae bacterium DAT-1]|nr:DUF5056 domain-containing protein [Burkholderiaceae bacterium DAT-1]